ncbi:MAG: PTS sugar transporter subunit IIA, partial [Selenomonadaceae bacterium]
FQEDKVKINRVMEQLKMVQPPLPVRSKQEWSFKHKISALTVISQAIVDILDGFFLLQAEPAATLDEVIQQVSETILAQAEKQIALTAALKKREELGGTIVTGQEMILLHCRTAAVAKPYFGAVQFQNEGLPVKNNGKLETLHLGIIMLVPENCSKMALEVMSHLSQMLLESTAFRSCLQTGIKDEAEIEIGLILKNYYRLQVKKLLEV